MWCPRGGNTRRPLEESKVALEDEGSFDLSRGVEIKKREAAKILSTHDNVARKLPTRGIFFRWPASSKRSTLAGLEYLRREERLEGDTGRACNTKSVSPR